MEFLELPRKARLYGNQNGHAGSHSEMDSGKGSGGTSTFNRVEERISKDSRKDPRLGKNVRLTSGEVKTFFETMEGTGHCDLRYP